MAELAQSKPQTELVIALGREECEQARPKGAQRYPHTLAMQAKYQAEEGRAAYRKRKWIAEPLDGWIKNVLGFRQFSMRGLKPLRMQALQKPRDRQTACCIGTRLSPEVQTPCGIVSANRKASAVQTPSASFAASERDVEAEKASAIAEICSLMAEYGIT
jgi:Transposase DDE domain